MEILIDNKKFHLERKYSTFGEIINEVHKKLKTEDKLLESIFINGDLLNQGSIVKVDKINLLEITSKSHRSIVYTALFFLDNYIDEYFQSLEIIENSENDSMFYQLKLDEIFNFLSWSLGLLHSLRENASVEIFYEDFNEFLEEFSTILDNLYKLLETHDYNAILDILEFEVSEMLIAFRDNIQNYKDDIILEENLSTNLC